MERLGRVQSQVPTTSVECVRGIPYVSMSPMFVDVHLGPTIRRACMHVLAAQYRFSGRCIEGDSIVEAVENWVVENVWRVEEYGGGSGVVTAGVSAGVTRVDRRTIQAESRGREIEFLGTTVYSS